VFVGIMFMCVYMSLIFVATSSASDALE